MIPRPKAAERLEKRLASIAREQRLDQERLRRWISFLAIRGALEPAMPERMLLFYYIKGGAALEPRFAMRFRATKDLDLGLEGTRTRCGPKSPSNIRHVPGKRSKWTWARQKRSASI